MRMMQFLKKMVWKCLWESKVVGIGIFRPYTIPQVIVEVVKVLDIYLKRPVTLPQVIAEVMGLG